MICLLRSPRSSARAAFPCSLLLLALLPLLAACRAPQPALASSPLTEVSTRIMSFNIRNAGEWTIAHDGSNAWPYRRAAVQRMISLERPDVIGLQEMLDDQVPFLDSVLAPLGYRRVGVGRDDGIRQGEMMAVYFRSQRFHLIRSATYWLSASPEAPSRGWDAACNRTATVVLLRDSLRHQNLLFINTHLDHVGAIARSEGVRLLADLANTWSSPGAPVVVGGDFNAPASEPIFAPFLASHLLSARTVAPQSDSSLTFNGFAIEQPSQIDHFFVRGLRPVSFSVLRADYGVPFISDHYPILLVY